MDTISKGINWHGRLFLGAAAAMVAIVQLGMISSAAAQTGETKAAGLPAVKPAAKGMPLAWNNCFAGSSVVARRLPPGIPTAF